MIVGISFPKFLWNNAELFISRHGTSGNNMYITVTDHPKMTYLRSMLFCRDRQHLHAQRRQKRHQETAEERTRRLDYLSKYYHHRFDFELVQDRDRKVPLARYNLSERFKHNETEEQRIHFVVFIIFQDLSLLFSNVMVCQSVQNLRVHSTLTWLYNSTFYSLTNSCTLFRPDKAKFISNGRGFSFETKGVLRRRKSKTLK